MPDTTITGLPNASALTGAERVPMDQSGTTVDAAASAIAALATKATVGLSNVDNTSDANKPISTATQTALDAKASAGAIGSSGLTMTAGVLGRESGTGAPVVLTLSGLSIVNGVLTVTASGSGTVTSVAMSVPTGFSVANSPITTTGALAVTYAVGYSLPLTASQASWDAAAALAATAVQPAGLTSSVQTSDARLSDSREWSAATVSQATAEAGISTSRLAFTPLRVFQSIAAYIAANFSAVGQALATAASAAAARTTLGLGSLATQSGTFSGTSSGTNTGDQTITLTGDVAGSGTGSFAATVGNAAVIGKVLTGFTSGAGTVAATDTILQAIQKLDGNDAAKLPITFTAGTITYAAQVTLDMAALAGGYRTISLTGPLEFLTSNRASGRQATLRLTCDSTARALTFPAGWVFVGPKPSTIAASKTAVLSLTYFGTADGDCVAAYGVQS